MMYTNGETAARITEGLEMIRRAVTDTLAAAEGRGDSAPDREALLGLVRAVDSVERTGHGLLLRVLARVDQAKAAEGGIGPWLSTHLGYQPGKGRAMAQDARRIGALPDLAEHLTTGQLHAGETRILARAAHAVHGTMHDPAQAVADTLQVLDREGVRRAEEHVRALEHTIDPGRAQDQREHQRSRSFARISELPHGMVRFDLLLDTERATTVRTALDLQTSAFLRARQYDGHDLVPADVITTEQLTAQAFTRLAETFLAATEKQRDQPYTPTVVYFTPTTPAPTPTPDDPVQDLPSPATIPPPRIPQGCAQTAYGALIPLSALPPRQDPAALHLTFGPDGQPVTLNGHPIDQDPTTRLATPAQRLALALRDQHCTHPACTRPTPWSLNAHHLTPYSQGGNTVMNNLTLLCSEHHILAHTAAHN